VFKRCFPILQKQGWLRDIENKLIRKDGSILPILINATAIYDENGNYCMSRSSVFDDTERKRAEEALARSETEYRNLFENASIGMFQSTFDPGRYLRANSAYARMLGYESPEDLISTITDITAIHVNAKDRADLLAALSQQNWYYAEYPRFREDGSIMIGKVAIRRILKSDGTIDFIEGIVEDVTEQRKAEEALANSEALYRNLIENSPIGMYQYSPAQNRLLRVNAAYAKMLGYESPEDMLSSISDPLTQIHFDPGHGIENLDSVKAGNWFYTEQPLLRKDGSIMLGKIANRGVLKPDGTIDYTDGFIEDITEQKRAEEALIQSERELRIKAQDLMDTNTTLKVLLNTMENDQEELKERFLDNIKRQVMPYFDQLKKRPLQEIEKGLVQMAEENLHEIASPFVQKLTSNYLNLTKKEIQIAQLVKDGKTSKEIAQILDASQRVIEFHRENIRRKLGLKKKKGSLAMLLRSFS